MLEVDNTHAKQAKIPNPEFDSWQKDSAYIVEECYVSLHSFSIVHMNEGPDPCH